MLDTYANLQSEIVDWLARPDLVAKAATFIALFEADLRPKVNALEQITTTAVSTVAGQQTVALPAATKGMIALAHTVSGYPKMRQVSPQELLESDDAKESGVPRQFALVGSSSILLAPIPDGAYQMTLVARENFTPLSDAATSNWVLEEFPNLYLYGSLKHAKSYMQDSQFDEVMINLTPALTDFDNELKRRKIGQGGVSFFKRFL